MSRRTTSRGISIVGFKADFFAASISSPTSCASTDGATEEVRPGGGRRKSVGQSPSRWQIGCVFFVVLRLNESDTPKVKHSDPTTRQHHAVAVPIAAAIAENRFANAALRSIADDRLSR